MVIKHLLSGMITEGTTLGFGPLLVTMLLEAAREGDKIPWKMTPGTVDFQQNSLLKTSSLEMSPYKRRYIYKFFGVSMLVFKVVVPSPIYGSNFGGEHFLQEILEYIDIWPSMKKHDEH